VTEYRSARAPSDGPAVAVVVASVVVTTGWAAAHLLFDGRAARAVLYLVDLLAYLGAIAGLVGVLVLRRRQQARPVGFVVRAGAFVVPPTRQVSFLVCLQVAIPILATGGLLANVGELRSSGAPPSIDGLFLALSVTLTVAVVAVTALFVAAVLSGLPRVELTADGVRYRYPLGRIDVPWEALRPGPPYRFRLPVDNVPLIVDRPDLVAAKGIVMGGRSRPMLQAYGLNVHPWFLTDAIRHYTDHPEHRAGIGTCDEHDRLVASLLEVESVPHPGF